MVDSTNAADSPVQRVRLGGGAWVVGPGFLALAAWFWYGPDFTEIPLGATPGFDRAVLEVGPRRAVLGEPPQIMVNGFDRTCMDCHRTFKSEPPRTTDLLQHAGITLAHGPFTGCVECHHHEDRDRLALKDGSPLPYTAVTSLCAQCHPSKAVDVERGTHGRTNGYWEAARGEVRRLVCTECHDPHRPREPAMSPLPPLPGPNTLRMGERPEHDGSHEERSPLYRALKRHNGGGH